MNRSLLVKTAIVAALAMLLMIPVAMIRDLVAERQARSLEAVSGIAEGWGKRQVLAGPYIAVPYYRQWTEVRQETVDGKARETRVERAEHSVVRIPAARVDWTIAADIGEKARGIYKARLYSAKLQAQGTVELPPRGIFEDSRSRYRWGSARLVLGIADPLGIRAAPEATIAGAAVPFSPGTSDEATRGGLHAIVGELPVGNPQTVAFSFEIELGGSEAFALAPLGADTTATMRADWPHPSFQGRFLPARHEVTPQGFTAVWKVSRFAAQDGAAAAGCAFPCNRMGQQVAVSFVEPASLYQQLERASKYGFLFLGLTFAAFMLFELLRRLAIHPVQYALVGLALAIFFLLLTALSEHIEFAAAYAIATSACAGLVSTYIARVLQSARVGAAFGAALSALYGMLYALLQAEDYSLLGGSILLFALLAAVMLGTRRIDWYDLAAARRG